MRILLRGVRSWPVLLLAGLAVAQPGAAPPNTASVAAFARLFGVIRYFYPSDRAASLDWDQFVVDGVNKTLGATDGGSLQATLRQLVEPLGPGIEIGTTLPKPVPPESSRERLIAWRYLGPGFSDLAVSPYRAKRTNRALIPKPDGMFTLMQTVPAAMLRGRAIRLRGQVRATSDVTSGAALCVYRDARDAARWHPTSSRRHPSGYPCFTNYRRPQVGAR